MSENINTNLIKINEIAEDFSNIEVKSYLSFGVKKVMIDTILETVVSENKQDLKVIDYSLLHFFKNIRLLREYTNIDLSEVESITEVFDQLCEKAVLEFVLGKIPKSELEFFDEILNQEINQIHIIENSVSSVLSKTVNKLIEKIPTDKQLKSLAKSLIKDVNKIDPDKLQYVTSAIGWNNGKSKSGDK